MEDLAAQTCGKACNYKRIQFCCSQYGLASVSPVRSDSLLCGIRRLLQVLGVHLNMLCILLCLSLRFFDSLCIKMVRLVIVLFVIWSAQSRCQISATYPEQSRNVLQSHPSRVRKRKVDDEDEDEARNDDCVSLVKNSVAGREQLYAQTR